MTTPTPANATLHLGHGNEAGDVRTGDMAGRDVVNGAPPEGLLQVIADAFGDERQYRRLEATAREQREERIDARLDRIAAILARTTLALVAQAVVLTLVLLVMIQVLVALLAPRLIAGA